MNRATQTASAVLAIARVTLAQLVRDPAILLVVAGAALLIAAAPAYSVFHFGELRKVLVDTGLSTALLAGMLIALVGPARALAYELEDRTALNLLSKPLGRWALVAGKYLGVAAGAVGAVLPLTLIVLYVVRIAEEGEDAPAGGLLLRVGVLAAGAAALAVVGAVLAPRWRLAAGWLAVTGAAAAGLALVGPREAWRWEVLSAGALVVLEVAVVAAAATAAAARFGAVGTMAGGLAVMLAGHARGLLEAARAADPAALALGAIPGLEALNGVEAAAAGVPIGAGYVALAALYAFCYVMALLLVGAALLQEREVA
jgi:hypothetical protein